MFIFTDVESEIRALHRLEKYTLIVTEKPDAAQRIASALDYSGKALKMFEDGVPYYIANRNGKIVVAPALGHLYTVAASKKVQSQQPIFDYKWVPRYQAERGVSRIRTWIQTIAGLAEKAGTFIDACDYDIEGSIIGYCILKYACHDKDKEAKRMKYSTLTKEELEKSYENLLPHLDYDLIQAGIARHEVDWIYGINLSRALTRAVKNATKQYITLSTGRVQGPTLKFLALRERSIASFVPKPYWTIKAKITIGTQDFEAKHRKSIIDNQKEAQAIAKACRTEKGKIAKIETKRSLQLPPTPFDLGSLQTEAYRLFGYSPIRTLATAQSLYLTALISYPRTSSQKLPKEIGYERILKNLAKNHELTKLANELLVKSTLRPVEGKKRDSAHPSIYPTGNRPTKTLQGAEKNIYNLIVRRFLAVFAEPAVRQTAKVVVDMKGEKFVLTGTCTLEEGWIHFYRPFAAIQDALLPEIKEDQEVGVKEVILEDRFSRPPPRYNPSSVLKKMEQEDIGTKATRAGIIQTLYDRKYIHGQRISVSDLGFEVTEVLVKHCPTAVSVEFTRQLEKRMEQIQQGTETEENVVADAVRFLKPVMEDLKENQKAIGEELSRSTKQLEMEERTIGTCPTCQTGYLIIQHSKRTGKRFVGCTNYFNAKCKTSFPLPQKGYIEPSKKACKTCGWMTVHILSKGKRTWNICFNPKCPRNQPGGKL